MVNFKIEANECLAKEIDAFFSLNYFKYGYINNPDFLNVLKNDLLTRETDELEEASNELKIVLLKELDKLTKILDKDIVVCVVPRAKKSVSYRKSQLKFLSTIKETLKELNIKDGTNYIKRVKSTKTTHLKNSKCVNFGDEPYCGISKDTCEFSEEIKGKSILLIDDIYTKTIDIDEDMIQALLDNGAKEVTFYAVSKTIYKG